MSLTPGTTWKRLMRRHPQPCVIVQIYTSNTTHYDYVLADRPLFGFSAIVTSITPISLSVNPLDRKPSSGEITIRFKDCDTIRDLVAGNKLRGKKVVVKFGAADDSSSNFVQIFAGPIVDVVPGEGKTFIDFMVGDAMSLLRDKKICLDMKARHPLVAMTDLFTAIGLASELIDTAKFDADYDLTMSHWMVYRTHIGINDGGVFTPESGLGLVSEIANLIDGTVFCEETGKITFRRYDPTATPVSNWTKSQIKDLRVIETFKTLVNSYTIAFGWKGFGGPGHSMSEVMTAPGATSQSGSEFRYSFEHHDQDSQGNYVYADATESAFAKSLETKWTGVASWLRDAIDDNDTSAVIHGGGIQLFTGSRTDTAFGALSSGRPAYFKIDDEIVKVTACTFSSGVETIAPDTDQDGNTYQSSTNGGALAGENGAPDTGNTTYHPTVVEGTYTIARHQFGTSPVAHAAGTDVVDVTLAVNLATSIVARMSDGLPIVEVKLPLHEIEPQIGELVTLTHDVVLAYGLDGVTSSNKWEVISKSIVLTGEEACVTYRLALARTPPAYTSGYHVPPTVWYPGRRFNDAQLKFHQDQDVFQDHVTSGLTISNPSGRNIQISAGIVNVRGVREAIAARSTNYQCPASKDTYISWDSEAHLFWARAVPNNDPAPTLSTSEALIATVVTDASSVTDIINQQTFAPIPGSKLILGLGSLLGGGEADGDLTVTSPTGPLTADAHYRNLTIRSGGNLKTNGFRVFVSGTLTLTGTGVISADGNSGSNGGNGGAGSGSVGSAGTASTRGTLAVGGAGTNGGIGGAPNSGNGASASGATGFTNSNIGGDGGNGGLGGGTTGGGTNGSAGAKGDNTGTTTNFPMSYTDALSMIDQTVASPIPFRYGAGGGGGGGGGADGAGSGGGGGGGGGGCGGDCCWIYATRVVTDGVDGVWTGRISAKGGNGGNGGNGGAAIGGGGGGGGGGGAGGGGLVVVIYGTIDNSARFSALVVATKGTKGTKGTGGAPGGFDGANGSDGSDGYVHIIELS